MKHRKIIELFPKSGHPNKKGTRSPIVTCARATGYATARVWRWHSVGRIPKEAWEPIKDALSEYGKTVTLDQFEKG